jgi:hypothetical protein
MKPFKYILLLLVLLKISDCFSQSAVLVDYDFITNQVLSVQYITEENDTLKSSSNSIKVKGETPLHIKLKNFNNEALIAESTIRKNSFVVAEGSSSFGGFLDTFSLLISPALGIDLDKILGINRGAKSQELNEMFPDFSALSLSGNALSAVRINSLINEQLVKIASWRTTSNNLNKLRYNTEFSKKATIESSNKLLASDSKDAPNSFLKDDIRDKLTAIAQENYDFLKLSLKAYDKAVSEINTANMKDDQLFKVELIKGNLLKYQHLVTNELETDLHKVLGSMIDSYEAIRKNTFETTLDLIIDENANLLTLQVFPKSNSMADLNPSPLKRQSISIKTPGNLIFSNSLGVSFIGFASPQKSYFLNDRSQIVDQKGDFILPTPTLFMNFLKASDKRVKLGGNFGVGVPLGEKRAIHFQLGPSLFLGKNNAIAINMGMVAGRVSRLGGGLKVGDSFTKGSDIPTIERYELGYQFGISFNMASGLNQAFNNKETASN